jgi:hypothetical protein
MTGAVKRDFRTDVRGLYQFPIIVVPEKAIGASFHDEPLSKFGFWADWRVEPKRNLCIGACRATSW